MECTLLGFSSMGVVDRAGESRSEISATIRGDCVKILVSGLFGVLGLVVLPPRRTFST
jgi:hypothetical protein